MKNITSPWEIRESEYPVNGSTEDKVRFLLRYAILAPSSHNTQPWRFAVNDTTVTIFADKTRWLRVADTDQRELYISIGCALENLLIAAEHFGYGYNIAWLPDGEDGPVAEVTLIPDYIPERSHDPALFGVIPQRCTSHKCYELQPIPAKVMDGIDSCCHEANFRVRTIGGSGDAQDRDRISAFITQADMVQYTDAEFKRELAWWVGQGVLGGSRLMSVISKFAIKHMNISAGQVKKDTRLVESAPSMVTLVSTTNGRKSQIQAGQVYERMALAAAVHGMAVQPMSQILEEPKTKVEFCSAFLENGSIPQHMFRLGYAEPEKAHTPRRPLEDVLV